MNKEQDVQCIICKVMSTDSHMSSVPKPNERHMYSRQYFKTRRVGNIFALLKQFSVKLSMFVCYFNVDNLATS